MIDAIGNGVVIGDEVIYVTPFYSEVAIGVIIGFTPASARIKSPRNGTFINRTKEQFIKRGFR